MTTYLNLVRENGLLDDKGQLVREKIHKAPPQKIAEAFVLYHVSGEYGDKLVHPGGDLEKIVGVVLNLFELTLDRVLASNFTVSSLLSRDNMIGDNALSSDFVTSTGATLLAQPHLNFNAVSVAAKSPLLGFIPRAQNYKMTLFDLTKRTAPLVLDKWMDAARETGGLKINFATQMGLESQAFSYHEDLAYDARNAIKILLNSSGKDDRLLIVLRPVGAGLAETSLTVMIESAEKTRSKGDEDSDRRGPGRDHWNKAPAKKRLKLTKPVFDRPYGRPKPAGAFKAKAYG